MNEVEELSVFQKKLSDVRKAIKLRPGITAHELALGYIFPLLDTMDEETAESFEEVLEEIDQLDVPKDLTDKAANIILGLSTVIDNLLVRTGLIKDGKYSEAMPTDIKQAIDALKADIVTWHEDVAAAPEDDEEEEEEGEDGDETEVVDEKEVVASEDAKGAA